MCVLCRDTALGLQESTEKFLASLNDSESALADMDEKLQHNLDIIDQVKMNILTVSSHSSSTNPKLPLTLKHLLL